MVVLRALGVAATGQVSLCGFSQVYASVKDVGVRI